MKNFPCVLVIIDGFGVAQNPEFEKIKKVMPTFFQLQKDYASTFLSADGESVGLPEGQVGNSEAGHQAIGAGRIILSDQTQITDAIKNGDFFKNPVFQDLKKHLKKTNGTLHVIGMLTDGQGSGHASSTHAKAILQWIKQSHLSNTYLHLITDGRDSPPFSAQSQLAELKPHIPKQVKIASVIGRFYAMDRDRHWERNALAYKMYVAGAGFSASSAEEAMSQAYARGESDEFIAPTIIYDAKGHRNFIRNGDAVLFWNLRSDRSRQLLKTFVVREAKTHEQNFPIPTQPVQNLFLATLTDFGAGIPHIRALYPHEEISGTFVEACRSLRQLYVAESEKFAQVTYFFNGGHDHAHYDEKRFIVPSPRVEHYEDVPQMSLSKIKTKIISELQEKKQDVIVANFANLDMVAHTGDEKAVLKACHFVDKAIKEIWEEVKKQEGMLVLTSDHGNAEELWTPEGGPDTQHNKNPVPFVIVSKKTKQKKMKQGTLCDVAPTVLTVLDVERPTNMIGENLLY